MDKENQTETEIAPVLQARSKSAIPAKTSNSGMTSVTMTLGNNSSKSVLKVLNGLTKLLQIDAPKHWQIEDKSGNMRDMFRYIIDSIKSCRNVLQNRRRLASSEKRPERPQIWPFVSLNTNLVIHYYFFPVEH